MLEGGLVRTKNAANVLTKNVLDFSLSALEYFAFGYAIYGADNELRLTGQHETASMDKFSYCHCTHE